MIAMLETIPTQESITEYIYIKNNKLLDAVSFTIGHSPCEASHNLVRLIVIVPRVIIAQIHFSPCLKGYHVEALLSTCHFQILYS